MGKHRHEKGQACLEIPLSGDVRIRHGMVEIDSRHGIFQTRPRHNLPLKPGSRALTINPPKTTGTRYFLENVLNGSMGDGVARFPYPVVDDMSDIETDRNFCVPGSQICIHFGLSSDWSDLCIIVGDNGFVNKETNGRSYPAAPARTVPHTQFHPNVSAQKMMSLLKLYDCVNKSLERTPSIKLIVK